MKKNYKLDIKSQEQTKEIDSLETKLRQSYEQKMLKEMKKYHQKMIDISRKRLVQKRAIDQIEVMNQAK